METYNVALGKKTARDLRSEVGERRTTLYARDMMESDGFRPSLEEQTMRVARLKLKDIGFSHSIELENIIDWVRSNSAQSNLGLCSPDAGAQIFLQNMTSLVSERSYVAMHPIETNVGPFIFELERRADGLILHGSNSSPGRRYEPEDEFVFQVL